MLCVRAFFHHFWRWATIANTDHQINEEIRDREVRLIGVDGEMLGIMSSEEALRIATEQEYDLVKIAPGSNPPVCRIMDYGKYRYEQAKKEKQNKRNAAAVKVKEIQLHPSVGDNDYGVKLRQVREFLDAGHRIKVSLFFRGRENAHKELGFDLMNRVVADVRESGVVEQAPKLLGRNIQMVIAPLSKAKRAAIAAEKAAPPKK